MALREPTKAEAKKLRQLLQWLAKRGEHSRVDVPEGGYIQKVTEFLASFPKDVRLDTVVAYDPDPHYPSDRTEDILYTALMRLPKYMMSIDLIKQVAARTPNVMHEGVYDLTALGTAKRALGYAKKYPSYDDGENIRDWQERVDLATQFEKEYNAKKIAKPLVSLTKTAKSPLAQKGLSEETESRIASFLTGNKGTVPEQMKSIRQTLGKGRRHRRTRKNSRTLKQ